MSAASAPSEDVSSPVPRSGLYEWRASLPPMTLRLPNFADKDFVPATLQSILVAMQEYLASPTYLTSQSMCLDLDAISSGDSEFGSSAFRASLVSIVDQEIAVISVHASDTEPDS